MTKVRQFGISAKLVIGYATILALMIGLAGFAIDQVVRIDSSLTTINDLNSVKQRFAINFRGSVHDRAISLRDYTLMSDQAGRDGVLSDIAKLTAAYASSAERLDRMFAERSDITSDERAILTSIKETEAKTLPLMKTVIDSQNAGDVGKAKAVLMQQARPAFMEWLARINQFIDLQEARNQSVGDDVRALSQRFTSLMLVVCAVALLIGTSFAWWSFAAIRPLRSLTDIMLKLAGGNLSVEIPTVTRRDEVSDITHAVQTFKDNALASQQRAELRQVEQQRKLAQSEHIEATTRAFETAVMDIVRHVSSAATELNTTAESMSSTSAQTATQSASAATAAQVAGSNVTTVADAAEELGRSVHEIGRQVKGAATLAQSVVSEADETAALVRELSGAATQIGEVVALIQGIASQTNLLALNATIEAARAGEAGRGFAVVASEVKLLAAQTSKATEEIGEQVATIQSSTQAAVTAIRAIMGRLTEISNVTNSISAAVDEQGAATQEIVRNVSQAAAGTRDVTVNIAGVAGAAEHAGTAANRVLASAAELTRQSDHLSREVQSFIEAARAA